MRFTSRPKKYIVRNSTKYTFTIEELNLKIAPGTHNLYELDSTLTFNKIEESAQSGTLAKLYSKLTLIPISEDTRAIQPEVIVKKSEKLAIFPNRARFAPAIIDPLASQFTDDELGIFDEYDDEKFVPAAKLQEVVEREKLKQEVAEAIAAAPPSIQSTMAAQINEEKSIEDMERLKISIKLGYRVCAGHTKTGAICRAQTAATKLYCPLHYHQE